MTEALIDMVDQNTGTVESEELLSDAWLMTTSNGFEVAVGKEEIRHLLMNPALHRLPFAPRFCQYLVEWEDRLLPLHDLGGWLKISSDGVDTLDIENTEENLIYAVVGFNLGVNRVEYGTIAITRPPELITVSDSDVIELDKRLYGKKMIIKSNFNYQGKNIPIINIKYLFTGVFSH